ncbi:unnamed protein product [Heligmosomoides polygyrus]|uniref:Uncharacterized protein n=1 Tax=Heligmosomoides polygyrus TaxID=6339 RepID=A0A3P7YHB0_HELPZ|nr:unnamed protein product [Heligmosomoides polygyrus]
MLTILASTKYTMQLVSRRHIPLNHQILGLIRQLSQYSPQRVRANIAEIIEQSIDDFLKLDPDPLDDRHPARTHPQAEFGNLLKLLFRNDDFMNKLVISYLLGRDQLELSVVAARLLLDCLPGLDAAVVFSEPSDFIPQLYVWTKDSPSEVLRAYAIGLLAAALEVQGNAHKYRANNIDLMPVALRRLTELKVCGLTFSSEDVQIIFFPNQVNRSTTKFRHACSKKEFKQRSPKHDSPPPKKRKKFPSMSVKVPSFASLQNLENSNSTWNMVQPYVIGTHKVHPLSVAMHQRFILQYLNPTGEYQDLLNLAIEGHAMDLILDYLDLEKIHDVRLTFDALRYLTSLLVHRKFALEFITRGGVAALVRVPRSSMASAAAITALYYLSYNEEVMEKVCQLNDKVLDDVVDYALWCLEHSYESGMGSAAMFFSHGFYYKPILERFDQKDGLRKMYNYMSTLTLLQEASKDKVDLTEEQHLTSSQAIRNAVAAFQRYIFQCFCCTTPWLCYFGCHYNPCFAVTYHCLPCFVSHCDTFQILLTVIRLNFPIADADQTRALACRALREFAKWDPVGQILSKLPFITGNELQGLMRQPVMLEKRNEHLKFCEEVSFVIFGEIVLIASHRLWKSHVIANTRVSYNEKELLQLIHDHLVKKGLQSTAAQLVAEAELPEVPASKAATTPARLPPLVSNGGCFFMVVSFHLTVGTVRSDLGLTVTHPLVPSCPSCLIIESSTAFPQRLQLRTSVSSSTRMSMTDKEGIRPYKGLDDIVTEYFRVQHSKCSHPVTTCPPFSLFYPHRCPEPRNVGSVPMNIVKRFTTRDILNKIHSRDEGYVFSRFRPSRTITEHEEMYTSCAFSIDDEHLIVGTFAGEVHWLNMESGAEESHTVCHSSGITSIIPSKDGNFLLTSSAYIAPLSALWKLGDQQEHAFDIPEEYFVQFSNLSSERIIGTSDVIYDTETGRLLRKFRRDSCPTGYTHNRASFSPCDTMILNDGVLYDVRGPVGVVHTFDQLNTTGCSVFHPQGNEIIINTEVWDTRTYRLLHLVPALEQCKLVFNSTGNIVYAAMYSDCADVFRNTYCASFRTFNTFDYSVSSNLRFGLFSPCLRNEHGFITFLATTSHGMAKSSSSSSSSAFVPLRGGVRYSGVMTPPLPIQR